MASRRSSRSSIQLLDEEADDDANQLDSISSIRSSIENLGRHLPLCIARSLEDNPLDDSLNENQFETYGRRSSMKSQMTWSSSTSYTVNSSGDCHASVSSKLSEESPISPIRIITPGQFTMPLSRGNQYHWAALLLVDISGFTKLSTLLDVESLSKTINRYFELLIREVEIFGGDVLKFAGDAFYAEWREEDAEEDEDLVDVVSKAAQCGASIVKKYSMYKVPCISSDVALLNVHCGLGSGQLATVHVGDNVTRREFLFMGSPIDQVSEAEATAENGQLAASPEAISLLGETFDIPDNIRSSPEPQVIAYREKQFFESIEPTEEEEEKRETQPYRLTYLSPNIMKPLLHQLSLYVHPAARNLCRQSDFHSRDVIADAEIRSVYTIFIKPQITTEITGDLNLDSRLFSLLNDIMGVTLKVLDRFKGHLRQFIVDDKGVVLIATFGQRGATFPNMVTEKGLPATIAIHDALKIDLDVSSLVGATFGKAYCGVVGGLHRHEFAILGPSVNLAARIMCSKDNQGILVDDAVRRMANTRFDFLTRSPVKAKGYNDLVPIFEPQSAIERQWSKINHFVGREAEVNQLVRIGRRQLLKKHKMGQLVLIQAHSGLGKSSLAMHVMAMISRIGRSYKKDMTIKKNVCKDGEQNIPFGVFRQILTNILIERCDHNDTGYHSDSSLSMDGLEDDLAHETDNLHINSLRSLCAELNYAEEFADLVAENLLGIRPARGAFDETKKKKLQPDDVVDLVSDVFLKCTAQSDFVMLALDDVQWMDSLSWNVVQRIVERSKNCMVMCLSRPIAINSMWMDEGFLKMLREENTQGSRQSRFTEIQLAPFTKNDVRLLLAAAFDCEVSNIEDDVCDYLFETTGGMPYFAQEIVGNLIRNDLLEFRGDKFVWRSDLCEASQKVLYSNVNDLLLHRLDEFKSYGRTLLQVCAVLGFEFSLSELLMVQCRGRKRKSKQIVKIQEVLNKADKERILVEISQGGPSQTRRSLESSHGKLSAEEYNITERYYTFTHSIWRNCVLGTMLKERERDLHRTVARILESRGLDKVVELRSSMKLFMHWKGANDLMKASELAQRIGKYFDGLLLVRQSIDVCLEAIQMWKDIQPVEENEESVAGISPDLLNSITSEELDCLARLHIAVARMGNGKKTRIFYQKCYSILTNSSAAANLTDRSVFFSMYSGLFILVKNGLIEDGQHTMQGLAKSFVEQAQIHGDPHHIARALAMESLTMSSLGKFHDAIAIQKRLEQIYSADELSEGICREYATDRAAQNYGYSVIWYEILGCHEQSEKQIDFILQELMPRMPAKNVHNSLIILCPVMWVLMERGEARKAEAVFVTYVYDRFYEYYGKDSTTFFFSMYKPLRTLFRLAGDAQEGQASGKETENKDIEDWVLSEDFGSIKEYISTTMRPYGKDPHCVFAEICWWLAMAQSRDTKRKRQLLAKGYSQAQISISHTKGNPGIEYAHRQSEKMMEKFRPLMSEVDSVVQFAAITQQAWEKLGQNENDLVSATANRKIMVDRIAAILENRLALTLVTQVGQPQLNSESKIELSMFVARIESLYSKVGYHSFEHASHVVISMNKLVDMLGISTAAHSGCKNANEEDVSQDPFTHFLLVFTALVHDVGQRSLSKKILSEQNHEIAVQHSNASMAERLSIDPALELLFQHEFSNIREAIIPTLQHKIAFGKALFCSVLCTDVDSQDRQKMCKARFDVAHYIPESGGVSTVDQASCSQERIDDPQLYPRLPCLKDIYRVLCLSDEELEQNQGGLVITPAEFKTCVMMEHMMQTADIAHAMQDWRNYLKWNFRLYKEMFACSSQGSMRNPSENWATGQIEFFDDYVMPLATRTEVVCCSEAAELTILVHFAEENRIRWEKEGDAVTAFFTSGIEDGESEEEVLLKCFNNGKAVAFNHGWRHYSMPAWSLLQQPHACTLPNLSWGLYVCLAFVLVFVGFFQHQICAWWIEPISAQLGLPHFSQLYCRLAIST